MSKSSESGIVKASYLTEKAYDPNPLIEALPPILSTIDIINKLTHMPKVIEEEKSYSVDQKIHCVGKVFELFQPLPINIDLEKRISMTLRNGYRKRNPLSPDFAMHFKESGVSGTNEYSAISQAIFGVSGMGKSEGVRRVLNLYPQVILHSSYKRKPLSLYQIVYIRVECPLDGSLKNLLLEIFKIVDVHTGSAYYSKMVKSKATTDLLIISVISVVKSICLGLLVIDEIQNLCGVKSGREKVLNFLLRLGNSSIPLLLIGTPKALSLFSGEFKQARRNVGINGDLIFERMAKEKEFGLFIKSIWKYQWVENTELSSDIIDAFYDETQGITDIILKLYASVQIEMITKGIRIITPSLVRIVSKERFSTLQPFLKAFQTGNIRAQQNFEDIYIPAFINQKINV